jgi:mRNA interferase MazF
MVTPEPKRGRVYWAALNPIQGHEQAGHRPVLVVSDDRFNAAGALVVALPLTSRDKSRFPLSVALGEIGGKEAFALPGQVRTLSKQRLGGALGQCKPALVERCLDALNQICGRISAR